MGWFDFLQIRAVFCFILHLGAMQIKVLIAGSAGTCVSPAHPSAVNNWKMCQSQLDQLLPFPLKTNAMQRYVSSGHMK